MLLTNSRTNYYKSSNLAVLYKCFDVVSSTSSLAPTLILPSFFGIQSMPKHGFHFATPPLSTRQVHFLCLTLASSFVFTTGLRYFEISTDTSFKLQRALDTIFYDEWSIVPSNVYSEPLNYKPARDLLQG